MGSGSHTSAHSVSVIMVMQAKLMLTVTLLATSVLTLRPSQHPQPYTFAYAVRDQGAGLHFSHREHSDGKVVSGGYQVRLPGGHGDIRFERNDAAAGPRNVR